MKEIKFRAWSKRNKVMKYTEEINGIFPNGVISLSNDAIISDLFQPEWEVMQFTGKKDINEKEIYEGDIVEFLVVDEGLVKGEVCFEDCSFIVKIGEHRYYLDRDDNKILGNKFVKGGLDE